MCVLTTYITPSLTVWMWSEVTLKDMSKTIIAYYITTVNTAILVYWVLLKVDIEQKLWTFFCKLQRESYMHLNISGLPTGSITSALPIGSFRHLLSWKKYVLICSTHKNVISRVELTQNITWGNHVINVDFSVIVAFDQEIRAFQDVNREIIKSPLHWTFLAFVTVTYRLTPRRASNS